MRHFIAAIFTLLAFLATCVSFLATKEAQWVWEQTQFICLFNFLIVGPLWLVAAYLCMQPTKRAILASIVVYLGVATCLSLFQVGLYRAQMFSGRRINCNNQLKQIGLALQQYKQKYGSFPPAYIPDANGKPMHSWRVLLLPFIEGESIYKAYSFSEPWDGPNNRQLISSIRGYHCPSDSGGDNKTSYVAVVGPGTAWPGGSSVQTSEIRDGQDKTLWVVEVADSDINWMEPRDLSIDQMDFRINGESRNSISSFHTKGANVLWADGSVQFLSDTLPPEAVRASLTIAGGEALPPDLREDWQPKGRDKTKK